MADPFWRVDPKTQGVAATALGGLDNHCFAVLCIFHNDVQLELGTKNHHRGRERGRKKERKKERTKSYQQRSSRCGERRISTHDTRWIESGAALSNSAQHTRTTYHLVVRHTDVVHFVCFGIPHKPHICDKHFAQLTLYSTRGNANSKSAATHGNGCEWHVCTRQCALNSSKSPYIKMTSPPTAFAPVAIQAKQAADLLSRQVPNAIDFFVDFFMWKQNKLRVIYNRASQPNLSI